jgi:hypothetical protein
MLTENRHRGASNYRHRGASHYRHRGASPYRHRGVGHDLQLPSLLLEEGTGLRRYDGVL